jgi:hypothetical protein
VRSRRFGHEEAVDRKEWALVGRKFERRGCGNGRRLVMQCASGRKRNKIGIEIGIEIGIGIGGGEGGWKGFGIEIEIGIGIGIGIEIGIGGGEGGWRSGRKRFGIEIEIGIGGGERASRNIGTQEWKGKIGVSIIRGSVIGNWRIGIARPPCGGKVLTERIRKVQVGRFCPSGGIGRGRITAVGSRSVRLIFVRKIRKR